jgi:hypothetical protein
MKGFSVKDLLIHLLHGGILLLTIVLALCQHQCIEHVTNFIPWFKASSGTATAFEITLFIAASYLTGLLLDAMADLVDTWIHECKWCKFIFPKFPFLQEHDMDNGIKRCYCDYFKIIR